MTSECDIGSFTGDTDSESIYGSMASLRASSSALSSVEPCVHENNLFTVNYSKFVAPTYVGHSCLCAKRLENDANSRRIDMGVADEIQPLPFRVVHMDFCKLS